MARQTPMNIQEQVALFHARALKDFCNDYSSLCINHGRVCPFYNEKKDTCTIGVPPLWDSDKISKERQTVTDVSFGKEESVDGN